MLRRKQKKWAMTAITRAPNSSYIADTLGQIYKNSLRKVPTVEMANFALNAFKDVERKAEAEGDPGLIYTNEESESFLKAFNNRGLFGFIQVAKIVYETGLHTQLRISAEDVVEKFNFFEWYLTYSRPDRNMFEPKYFFKDVSYCFKCYTKRNASESTSFSGLLEYLNQNLSLSRVRRAGLQPASLDLEMIQSELKLTWEENRIVSDAERYILSNFLLCNQNPNSNHLAPVRELQSITTSVMRSTHVTQTPEFYLLVSLLFWPEQENNLNFDEIEGLDVQSHNEHNGDEERAAENTEDVSVDIVDIQEQVNNMEKAFEGKYAKYLNGRYLVPLFFLGNSSGLTKWVHRSKLDAIVEERVNSNFDWNRIRNEEMVRIKESCNIWSSGEVWHIPEVQELLQPVNVEPCEEQEEMVWVRIGGNKIMARIDQLLDAPIDMPVQYYLGFNIQGPVVFKVGPP